LVKSMKTIRASEVGSYLFCARAWWYSQHGVESTNQTELTAGTELHRQHGRTVIASGLTRLLAVLLLLAALGLLVAFCTARFI
jgi:CRISPR/Cas system-associated exonuclease Cas4 (RecB family)